MIGVYILIYLGNRKCNEVSRQKKRVIWVLCWSLQVLQGSWWAQPDFLSAWPGPRSWCFILLRSARATSNPCRGWATAAARPPRSRPGKVREGLDFLGKKERNCIYLFLMFLGKTPEEVVKRYLQKVRNLPEEVSSSTFGETFNPYVQFWWENFKNK